MTRQVQQHTMSGNISSCISSSSSDDDEGAMSSSLSRVLVSSSAADEDEMLMVLSSSSHLRSSSTSPYGCYRDFFYKEASEIQAAYIETPKAKRRGPRGGVSVPFPVRLYDMLESVEKEQNREHVVSWLPHGRSFIVHQPEIFVSEIMPK